MLLAIDVQYTQSTAFVAGVVFNQWSSATIESEHVSVVENVEDYVPGSFYKRELPCILTLLQEHQLHPNTIIIDGYVYLNGTDKPGLGKHLYDALQQQVEIIGVAKKPFAGIPASFALLRGSSEKPLYITASGSSAKAKQCISKMTGENRIPTILKRADQLCRAAAK